MKHYVNGELTDLTEEEVLERKQYLSETVNREQSERRKSIRDQRTQLLKQSDWVMLPDVVTLNRDEWVEYRQALRNVTDQIGFPENVEWPETPK